MRILVATAASTFPFAFDGGSQRGQHELTQRLAEKGLEFLTLSVLNWPNVEHAIGAAAQVGCKAEAVEAGMADRFGLTLPGRYPQVIARTAAGTSIAVSPFDFQAACRGLLDTWQPALVVTWLEGSDLVVSLAKERRVPCVLRVFDPVNRRGLPRSDANHATVIANAPVTAQACARHCGRSIAYLVEPVDHGAYTVERREPSAVTFVNPVRPKGLALAHEIIARLPRIPFLLVRGWTWSAVDTQELMWREELAARPNVRIIGPEADMRKVYRMTKLLLMPSRWLEAWGRVAAEAQINGIPAIVSNRGSLPLHVGRGGFVLDYGDADLWAQAIEAAYTDAGLYQSLSAEALENTRRFPFSQLIERYLDLFVAVAEGRQPMIEPPTERVRLRRIERSGTRMRVVDDEIGWEDPVDLGDPEHP